MIHSYGDSHAKFSFSGIPNVITHNIGPVTMESVGKNNNIKQIKIMFTDFNIKKDDIVIFCFGEIDCRVHIKNNIEHIDIITTKYIDTILELKKEFPNIWIMSVIPPAYSSDLIINQQYPFVGNDSERSEYTNRMNVCLRRLCEEKNIVFFDIYDDYKDENGMLKPELSYNKEIADVHIGNTIFVENKLKMR
jgi:hypothetical protein